MQRDNGLNPMTKKKKPEHTEDSNIFREEMRGVIPFSYSKISPHRKKPRLSTIQKYQLYENENTTAGFQFSDYDKLEFVGGDDFLHFARSGIQHKILRKMRLGQYTIDAILDLHGKTTLKAGEALSEFLLQCEQRRFRHVLVIHGKGKYSTTPVLKNKLNHWLRQTDQVIAFCTASPKNGGSGALYVLLRR